MDNASRTEELRLALVLNGGVSLAVWMGGVAHELNRLVAEAHPVYRALLELTGTVARIDVISGTSAGGINGAALALAQLHGTSLAGLRKVWLDDGGLEQLLHDPDDERLRGLLKGDEHLLPALQRAFKALAVGLPASADAAPVDLTLTATLLDGKREESLDDFGAEIEDKVHRAVWRFPHLPGDDKAFQDRRITEQLAFAARSSASFPVAFAPARFEPGGKVFAGAEMRLVARTAEPTVLSGDTFLVDGGVLDNKPFQAALEGIARLPAEGNTRRVLAYIVPDPAERVNPREPVNGVLETPALAQVAWRSLVSIPGAQSIAAHMAELRRHNDEAARRWKRLIGAVVHMRGKGLLDSAQASMAAYRARRVDGIVQHLLEETEKGLAKRQAAERAAAERSGPAAAASPQDRSAAKEMRRATRQWLASTWRATAHEVVDADDGCNLREPPEPAGSDLRAALVQRWRARIPSDFDAARSVLGEDWGIYPLGFMAEFTTEVLRRTQRLYALVPRWALDPQETGLPKPRVEGPAIPVSGGVTSASAEPGPQERVALRGRPAPKRARLADDGKPLAHLWKTAYELAADIRQRRELSNQSVQGPGADGFIRFVESWRLGGGQQPPMTEALRLLNTLLQAEPRRPDPDQPSQVQLARALFGLLLDLRPFIQTIVDKHGSRPGGRADINEAVCELKAIADYLFPSGVQDTLEARLNTIAWRVLALEVFEVTACSRRDTPGVQAEVVQISARLASAFGGSDDPACKLNGMQLAHFGAFYKRSWRANDWTFGRLDGMDRIVRIALNPDALQRRYGNRTVEHGTGHATPASQYVLEYLHALAVGTADADMQKVLGPLWQQDLQALQSELAWLDHAQTVAPPMLERCATAITRRLQLEALREEIPTIAESLRVESLSGAPPSADIGARLLDKASPHGARPELAPAQVAVDLVQSNLLGAETLKLQLGTDRMTRTVGHGLATVHAALSVDGKLTALKVLFQITSWPIRIFYWLASRLSQPGNTSVALEALAYGVGFTIVATAGLSEKVPATLLAFGWALLSGAIATSLLRSVWIGVPLLLAALVLLLGISPGAAGVALALLVVYGLLLLPGGAAFAALIGVALAAWWSAGAQPAAVTMLWHEVAGSQPRAPFASLTACTQLAADAERLWLALRPALAVGVFMVLAGTLMPMVRSRRGLRKEHAAALLGCLLVSAAVVCATVQHKKFDCPNASYQVTSPSVAPQQPGAEPGRSAASATQGAPSPVVVVPVVPAPVASAPQPGSQATAAPDAGTRMGRLVWPFAVSGIAAMLVGGALLVRGRSGPAQIAGTLALLSGLTANGYLVKEVHFGGLTVQWPKPSVSPPVPALSEFGPQQLAQLGDFAPGEADLPPAHLKELEGVCTRWRSRAGAASGGMLMIVGSTDRVALNRAARLRYESNAGLARARAEQVALGLARCGVPTDRMVTLVSGPRNTPASAATGQAPGFAEDRSVAVWALWSVPVPAQR